MAIPSGSGSEVLKTVQGQVRNATTSVLTVASLHIVTIISISLCTEANTATTFDIQIYDGSTNWYIMKDFALGGNSAFVYNDKLVLQPAFVLKIKEPDNVDLNYYVSYIDQDWT